MRRLHQDELEQDATWVRTSASILGRRYEIFRPELHTITSKLTQAPVENRTPVSTARGRGDATKRTGNAVERLGRGFNIFRTIFLLGHERAGCAERAGTGEVHGGGQEQGKKEAPRRKAPQWEQ